MKELDKDQMKIVKDPVHGDIYLSYVDCKLIDTPEVQRLRMVSQLGTVHWVYPGGTHTRFEHSIGMTYLALKIARNVLFERNEIETLKEIRNQISAAAIFHDCGHLPFSHCLEETGFDFDHKKRSAKIAVRVIDSMKQDVDLSGKEISQIILGKRKDYLSDIISGTLDADRLDYLLRDQLHTGATYGGIDLRLLSLFRRRKFRLVIDKRGVIPAETVLHSRFVLRSIMYDHKITRLIQAMIAKAFEYATGRDDINKRNKMSDNIEEIAKLTDGELLSELEKYKYSKELVENIRSRSLFKLAGIALRDFLRGHEATNEKAKLMTRDQRWEWENQIVENLKQEGVKPYEIIIDKGRMNRYEIQEARIRVYHGEEDLGPLGEVSGIAKDINLQHEKLWGIRLYAPEKILEKARKEFTRVSGIELEKPLKLRIPYSEFR